MQIVIPYILLKSKHDESNVGRKVTISNQFTWQQYPICPTFAITINKSQNQSFCYISVDIQVHKCFNHSQFYVAVSRVAKKRTYISLSQKLAGCSLFGLSRASQDPIVKGDSST